MNYQTRWRLCISSPDVYRDVTEENICHDHGCDLRTLIEASAADQPLMHFCLICDLRTEVRVSAAQNQAVNTGPKTYLHTLDVESCVS